MIMIRKGRGMRTSSEMRITKNYSISLSMGRRMTVATPTGPQVLNSAQFCSLVLCFVSSAVWAGRPRT